jgi:Xaa-Pro aminopeptidase
LAIPDRLNRLRQQLSGKGLDAVLISQPENYRYLSGFAGSAGVLLVTQDSAVLATDFIHLEQAKKEATGVETVRIKNITQGLAELMRGRQIQGLGFEADVWTFSQHRRLAEEAEKLKIELVPTEGLVESLRAVKEDEETDCLVRAAEIADRAVEYAARRLRADMSERELAWETERFLRENGSEAVPFPIIVASGPNAALPHASPTERTISPGEPVVVDLGATVAGYSSDLTRTLCLGPRGETFDKIYGLVLQAQMSALNNLEAGMKGGQVDSLARREIEEGGYGSAFGHGLGHGVGLAVHESPRLGPDSGDVVEEGMVFCIEPGIYLPEWGGVRIEDTVVLRDGRAEVLTKAGK